MLLFAACRLSFCLLLLIFAAVVVVLVGLLCVEQAFDAAVVFALGQPTVARKRVGGRRGDIDHFDLN